METVFQYPMQLIRDWITPSSKDRDIAFRERGIRITILIVLLVTVLSFSVTAFSDEWRPFSIPTLHIGLIVSFVAVGTFVRRGSVTTAGLLLVVIFLLASASLAVLSREEGSLERSLTVIPAFLFAIVVASVLVPTQFIMYISVSSIILFSIAQYVIPVVDTDIPSTEPFQVVGLAAIVMLLAGVTLRQLRIEFDARLKAMSESIQQMESARKQAEEDRERAEKADQAKSQFLANMSHELRTPLNAIIGYDEAMLAGMVGEFEPQQTKLLGHIQHNSRRLLNLINDILDLSKIESGSVEIYIAPMSPRKIIHTTVESLQSLATEKQIDLEVVFSDELPEVVMGDARKLEQVLVNLLSNAIKFTNGGSVTVRAEMLNDNQWQFVVQDTGVGIPEEAHTSIFEPFQQVDGTTTRRYKGTGLGLSITKQLVEKMAGTIHVESEPGVGSSFSVILPRLNIPTAEPTADTSIEEIPVV